jgi:hypothetical protein
MASGADTKIVTAKRFFPIVAGLTTKSAGRRMMMQRLRRAHLKSPCNARTHSMTFIAL